MIYALQAYLIICVLFSAGHDSSSIRLRQTVSDYMTIKRIRRWHRDGFLLYVLFCVPVIFIGGWKIAIAAALIRASIFDLALNKWTDYNYKFIGTTAFWDKQFSKIFGKDGAVKKSLAFLLVLIALNILNELL